MNIKLTGQYKSLKSFSWENIPNFTIITGLNGAGKSQLLELVHNALKAIYQKKAGILGAAVLPVEFSAINFDGADTIYLKGEWELGDVKNIDLAQLQLEYATMLSHIQKNNLETQYFKKDFKLFTKLKSIEQEFKAKGKSRGEIEPNEFREAFELSTLAEEQNVAYKMSSFFYSYQLKYLNLKLDEKSDEDIVAEIGPKPWDVLRAIITEANLPFEISDPSKIRFLDSFKFALTKKGSSGEILFKDLSSGERVLFALAFMLFNSQEASSYPKLLLLDEPDAHLHPSMTAQMINVLKHVLVDRYGVRVIMTTHSPSTVAISPEDALFHMEAAVGYPVPTKKDFAIRSLLVGIPNLFVTYENRRQVFVESGNDVNYYGKLYTRLLSHLDPEVTLNFISSGDSRKDKNGQPVSNCAQVKDITEKLNDAGNTQAYGIVDYDEGKISTTDHIKVLGEGNRYSIENYIFDPMLVGMFLLREKYITAADSNVPSLNYLDKTTHTIENLQGLSDYVVGQIFSSNEISAGGYKECKTVGGIKLSVANCYLMHQGHQLEDKLVSKFHKLGEIKRQSEDKLKLAIIEKVIDDLPDLTSIDIVTLLNSIQL